MANSNVRKFKKLDDETRNSNIFWKFEYLKRHLLTEKNNLMQNIFAISNNVLSQLRKNKELDEFEDTALLTLAINESIIMNLNKKFYITSNSTQFKIGSSLDCKYRYQLECLRVITVHFNIYAHQIINLFNPENILKCNIKVIGGSLLEYCVCNFFKNGTNSVHLKQSMTQIDMNNGELIVSIDLKDKNFDIDRTLETLKTITVLAKREYDYVVLGKKYTDSKASSLDIYYSEICDDFKHAANISRAIGLLLWDRRMGINYDTNHPPLSIFSDSKAKVMKEHMRELVQAGLLKEYAKVDPRRMCCDREKSCLIEKNFGGKRIECECLAFPTCKKFFQRALNNAKACISQNKILPI